MAWKTPAVLSLGLALSTTVYAYVPRPTPMVTLPQFQPGFEVGLELLALKPGASNLNYVIYNRELPTFSPTWVEKEIRPGYAPAFGLNGRYFFAESRDVKLDWTHLNTTSRASTYTPNDDFFLGPDWQIGPTGIPIRYSTGHATFRYDVVNLDVGQYVDFGRYVQLRFFGGLSNGFLREQVDSTYQGVTTAPAGPFSMMQQVKSNFTGIGPRFGISTTVETDYDVGFLGEAAFSALIGSLYSKSSYTAYSPLLFDASGITTNYQYIKDQNVTQVVPALDAKLGVSYQHRFRQNTQVTFKAGYQAAVYINAISQYIPATQVDGTSLQTGGIFVATTSHTLSNYSVQGPFVEADIKF